MSSCPRSESAMEAPFSSTHPLMWVASPPMNEKLDVGTVLERVLGVYRSQFGLLIPAALILFLPIAILNGLIATGGGVLAALLAGVLGVVATFWYQGMVVEATEDILDGRRDHTIG